MDDQTQSARINIDPQRAFAALQRNTAEEFARLHGEIAARDAYIEQLKDRIADLETPKDQ